MLVRVHASSVNAFDVGVAFTPRAAIHFTGQLVVHIMAQPSFAVPLSGTWIGFPDDGLGMTVEVSVTDAAASQGSGKKKRADAD